MATTRPRSSKARIQGIQDKHHQGGKPFGACVDIISFCWARFILAARLCFDARAAVVVYLYLSIRCHCAGLVGYRGGWSARHR